MKDTSIHDLKLKKCIVDFKKCLCALQCLWAEESSRGSNNSISRRI